MFISSTELQRIQGPLVSADYSDDSFVLQPQSINLHLLLLCSSRVMSPFIVGTNGKSGRGKGSM